MNKQMFQEFIMIAKALNEKKIVPLLMGSLGLEIVTKQCWDPKDIDIHVPGDERGWEASDEERIYNWDIINEIMTRLDYVLINLHEHEFKKNDIHVEFGSLNTLPSFAGIKIESLESIEEEGVK